ncbi:hypothetical protein HBI56_140330 [Parastagonospora nodorum]|uniref:Uncharacterized protein n=1 Tax=Phaeosphaeria nodorum (strain SN15 / ATCC MYA-4574 / FGSC 10173) TaxID=321614 RepID=A0A7U2I9I9_PHANO|nr:hypothetical protein HBH56_127480 [Parastagonospora nodorum]QRD05741.1 hypothetical protein JI435_060120 [Parastagonospora nodorum SN15]KAH3931326.1 hypothetical protein HBH54_096020 [Parastagonospora nodorum]KAH3947287.1 hypothetical protein HBH53_117770 [Parastagonospora nodorum]KAH3970618.1 hypothetical protein HBH51_114190 [Parastagonospora nodorum]
MQLFISVVALLSTLVTALPAPTYNDGRGATIYTSPNFQGDSTFVPGTSSYCGDLNNIFGNFDGRVRSIVVEKGYRCQFYIGHDCPANGSEYDCGSKDASDAISTLPDWVDSKVHSIFCAKI